MNSNSMATNFDKLLNPDKLPKDTESTFPSEFFATLLKGNQAKLVVDEKIHYLHLNFENDL